jgi:hypothetical protein
MRMAHALIAASLLVLSGSALAPLASDAGFS